MKAAKRRVALRFWTQVVHALSAFVMSQWLRMA
jgi:hypothetical protein